MAFQRGLNENQEQNQAHIIRDTRPLSTRISDTLKNPRYLAIFLFCLVLSTYFVSYLADVILLVGIGSFIFCFMQKTTLPFRLPKRVRRKDYNDLIPGTRKPKMGDGIYFLGNDKRTGSELWFSNEDMRTHALIFGSTGSGKTEFLVSIAYNALLQASGFIYVDGKGDNSLFAKVFSMVRSMGREDDMLLINFMTGAKDIIGPQEKRLSNTLNPFSKGSSSMLANLIVSLMDSSSASQSGDMWKGRAIGFVEALMRVLVVMRDAGHILLDANTIRQYFLLPKLEAMVIDKVFLREDQPAVNLEHLPPNVLEPIQNYVYNLPGYNAEKKGAQVSQVLEQHGYITMQLTRAFTSLADTYGHILRTNLAEVDLSDVVLNRRILCVLLPALEKSPDELANLGKVIIATLKAMMAAGLGDSVEGKFESLIESKPTNSETPFLCILDEYGYYAVEGFAVVPAQARSLGFSVVFAGQDLPAFQKSSKEEAASIGANTNIKICMKLEDPTETWDFFMKSAGESYVTQVENFQVDQGSVLGNYQDGRGARVEKRARIDLLDLKEQTPGEAHFFFKSKIVRGRAFYANPKNVRAMRLNHFLKVDKLLDAHHASLVQTFQSFEKYLQDPAPPFSTVSFDEEAIAPYVDVFVSARQSTEYLPIEAAIESVLGVQVLEVEPSETTERAGIPEEDELLDLLFGDEKADNQESERAFYDIFSYAPKSDHLVALLGSENIFFKTALLDRKNASEQLKYINQLWGLSTRVSHSIAEDLVGSFSKLTEYPPSLPKLMSPEELAIKVRKLAEDIDLRKQSDT